MLDQSKRAAILELSRNGHSINAIHRAVNVSRRAIRSVLSSGSEEIPKLERMEKAEPYRDQILESYGRCGGNLVLVHEELVGSGVDLSYPALTAFCRRHEIGHKPKLPTGHYTFAPGQEMQHDTSPHRVEIGGVRRLIQTASLVLAYSRLIFIQCYPTFNRFDCKVFLVEAFKYVDGVCSVCMIDNTHVVVLHGTGKNMVPVPEMASFAERFGFTFKAHERGDANRSAQVEGHFNFVENNFIRGGRQFADFTDLNNQAREWCDKANAKFSSKLHASRRELFAAEKPHLKRLPIWIPPVYRLHDRIVGDDGYVKVNSNRYSVPYKLIGHSLEVRETKDHIEVYDGPRKVATHLRLFDQHDGRVTLPEHRPPRGEKRPKREKSAQEEEILSREPLLASYVAALKSKVGGQAVGHLRRLLKLLNDYPRQPLLDAADTALEYGMFDIERLERMVLRFVGQHFFTLPEGVDGKKPR